MPRRETIDMGKGVLFYNANVPPGTVSIEGVELTPWSITRGFRTKVITPALALPEKIALSVTGRGAYDLGAYRVSVRDRMRVVSDKFIARPRDDTITVVVTET
jgi:hypothetical protein